MNGDLDWGGFAAVMGILVFSLIAAFTDWFRNEGDQLLRLRVDQALTIDHEQCRHESCDTVVCYCRGFALPCPGTVWPGCHHVSLICDDHRYEDCEGCVEDARLDAYDMRTREQRFADQDRFDTVGLPRGGA